jgi:hypothetical protein
MTDEQKLAWFEARAEAAYDKMYDASNKHRGGGALRRYQGGAQ